MIPPESCYLNGCKYLSLRACFRFKAALHSPFSHYATQLGEIVAGFGWNEERVRSSSTRHTLTSSSSRTLAYLSLGISTWRSSKMLSGWVGSVLRVLASIGMAVGPPLVYADQTHSIVKKKCVHCLVFKHHALTTVHFSQGTRLASQETSVVSCTCSLSALEFWLTVRLQAYCEHYSFVLLARRPLRVPVAHTVDTHDLCTSAQRHILISTRRNTHNIRMRPS